MCPRASGLPQPGAGLLPQRGGGCCGPHVISLQRGSPTLCGFWSQAGHSGFRVLCTRFGDGPCQWFQHNSCSFGRNNTNQKLKGRKISDQISKYLLWRMDDVNFHIVKRNDDSTSKTQCCWEAADPWDGRSLWWEAVGLSLLLIWWPGSLWRAKGEEVVSWRCLLTFQEVRSSWLWVSLSLGNESRRLEGGVPWEGAQAVGASRV